MSNQLSLTAGTLRAMLCFINPNNTPKIAYDKDEYALPLIKKVYDAVGDKDGSQPTCIWFDDDEKELLRQFNGVANGIKNIFDNVSYCTEQ